MSPLSIAALAAALLALAGCTQTELDQYASVLQDKTPTVDTAAYLEPLPVSSVEPTPVVLTTPVLEPSSSSAEPRYVELDGTGPMGETLASGPDCRPQSRVRICVDQQP